VLAAAHPAGVRVTVYTFDKPGLITKADRELPPRLAVALALGHRLIEPSAEDDQRLALFDLHTAGHTREVDREYVARRQWDRVPPTALALGGGTWEVGRCRYHTRFDEILPDESSDAGRWFGEWIAWVRATPQPALDWRDRFYIEQKLAGWRSSVEQGIDITGRQRVHIANCADVFSCLLALPVESRRSGDHQLELIRMLAPELSHFPVNLPEPRLTRLRRRLLAMGRERPSPWP
jgi:hypothetical protein